MESDSTGKSSICVTGHGTWDMEIPSFVTISCIGICLYWAHPGAISLLDADGFYTLLLD